VEAAPTLPRAGAETRSRAVPLALVGVLAVAALYDALQAPGHATPAIFTDELVHAKVAQSLAAGQGFTLRASGLSFPAALPMLAQAPAWLPGDPETGYALAKALNGVLMSSAVFPACWLARQLARPAYALVAAALTVAAPALVYHSYLLSEALACPVFLLAVTVLVRAWSRPSSAGGLAVLGSSALAVTTRVQVAAVHSPTSSSWRSAAGASFGGTRSPRWRSSWPARRCSSRAKLPSAVRGGGVARSPSARRPALEPADGRTGPLRRRRSTRPCGGARALTSARTRAEAAFGVLACILAAVTLLEAAFVASGEAHRALERYTIYLPPLLFCAFALALERGFGRPRLFAAVAAVLGSAAWLAPFPSLADYLFSFDSPTLSAYGELARLAGHPNAATAFSGGASVLCRLVACKRSGALAEGLSAAVLVALGVAAYAGDHAMTQRTRATFVAADPDWLDARHLGPALYLELPRASPHFGWTLET
jgi:hypothetical protein